MDRDSQCNTQSIGSTFSNNSGPKTTKIDKEMIFLDHTDDWHVVPWGGAKARSNGKSSQPHPFRYVSRLIDSIHLNTVE